MKQMSVSQGSLAKAVLEPAELMEGNAHQAMAFTDSLAYCTSFQRTGVVLCWWVIAGWKDPVLDDITQRVCEEWTQKRSRQAHRDRARSRGSTFPIREGELHEMVESFQSLSLASAVTCAQLARFWVDCWVFLIVRSLNVLSGAVAGPFPGRWTQMERSAVNSIRASVRRKRGTDELRPAMTLEAWQKEMSGRQIGYNGEEISICHKLSWDQVIPALPPEAHGGCISALDWVGPQTQRFLLNPELLLKEHHEVELPRMPGRVHVEEGDKLRIAQELVKRGVCRWIPLESVYRVGTTPVLNGLFGVEKPTKLADGRVILRCIMNLTGSNATQWQLEGGTRSLPNITAWQSVALSDLEELTMFQSDMCSAFYLFRLPVCWLRHLAFNVIFPSCIVGGPENCEMALACQVLPMGWLSSVSIMQEISEKLLKHVAVGPFNQISRGSPLPCWFSDILLEADKTEAYWWHVYLDNFCAGERTSPSKPAEKGRLCHEAAEKAWMQAGVLSSEKKRVSASKRVLELGAEIDGEAQTLGVGCEKLLDTILCTLWLVGQPFINRKHLQIVAGRWVFFLQFRRPGMSFLQKTWAFTGGSQRITAKLREEVRKELLFLVSAAPLFHCFLGAGICKQIVATDASEKGGAVGFAEELSAEGHDFLQACRKKERLQNAMTIPVLVLSLFNGIGGAFRAYDILGVQPLHRIAAELDDGANRITSRRWPGTLIVKDVKLINEAMVKEWSRTYTDISEIHLWGGFPCTDLSAVKVGRWNLLGSQSSLFWEIPRISKLLREHFGEAVLLKEVLENVASMDKSAAEEITEAVGHVPYKLDCVQAVPMRRPRFAWTTETLEALAPDVKVILRGYFKEVEAYCEYPDLSQWLTPGYDWKGYADGSVLPTCLKSIPRDFPPPRPAGLQKCDPACRQRWTEDQYRYPPYQYQDQYLITSSSTWRLVNAREKEILLGYGAEHTKIAWSASKQKQNPIGFSDAQNSYLGDSFSIYSFVLLALACCRNFVPQMPYGFLCKRMGTAPGFCAHFRSIVPLCRHLAYGSSPLQQDLIDLGMDLLNRMLLRRVNHTGSDIRVVSGEIMNAKSYPRQSVSAAWWHWKDGFNQRWQKKAHINVLELESILWGVKYQLERFKVVNARIFQLSDSYVCISVVGKGRSSSAQLQRVLSKLNAHLLAHGLQLIMGHIESTENPTDFGSRR